MISDPAVLREIAKRVQAKVRDGKQPNRNGQRAELASVERELENVVAAVAKLGGSAALLARVRELEASKARLVAALSETVVPEIVPNVEAVIRERVRAVEKIPRHRLVDAELLEKARVAVRGLLGGDAVMIEKVDGLYARVDLGRMYIALGAQERT